MKRISLSLSLYFMLGFGGIARIAVQRTKQSAGEGCRPEGAAVKKHPAPLACLE